MRLSSLLVEVLGVQETVVEAAVLENEVLLQVKARTKG